jgi:hypothetical protein
MGHAPRPAFSCACCVLPRGGGQSGGPGKIVPKQAARARASRLPTLTVRSWLRHDKAHPSGWASLKKPVLYLEGATATLISNA